jgi:hypothetical protein
VIEFYASAIAGRLQDGGVVVVQGVEILINPEVINQFFEVPDVAIRGGGGVEYLDTLDPFRGRLAAVLRMDGLEQWDLGCGSCTSVTRMWTSPFGTFF